MSEPQVASTGLPKVAVLPEHAESSDQGDPLVSAVRRAGLGVTNDPSEADALIWRTPVPDGLADVLAGAPRLRWVQLPWAGVEDFVDFMDDGRVWTCAKEVYGPCVAEFALGLLIAGFRRIDRFVAAGRWTPFEARTLEGASVTILGGGGIGRSLSSMLAPLGASLTVVSRSGAPVPGATSLLAVETPQAVRGADAVVLALPLTAETKGLVDARFLETMKTDAWLVNVARGQIVITDDLCQALRTGSIGGAALDVTDPEPLPSDHPLWDLDNAIITPHAANTAELGARPLRDLVEENARRFREGEPLLGLVDPASGY